MQQAVSQGDQLAQAITFLRLEDLVRSGCRAPAEAAKDLLNTMSSVTFEADGIVLMKPVRADSAQELAQLWLCGDSGRTEAGEVLASAHNASSGTVFLLTCAPAAAQPSQQPSAASCNSAAGMMQIHRVQFGGVGSNASGGQQNASVSWLTMRPLTATERTKRLRDPAAVSTVSPRVMDVDSYAENARALHPAMSATLLRRWLPIWTTGADLSDLHEFASARVSEYDGVGLQNKHGPVAAQMYAGIEDLRAFMIHYNMKYDCTFAITALALSDTKRVAFNQSSATATLKESGKAVQITSLIAIFFDAELKVDRVLAFDMMPYANLIS